MQRTADTVQHSACNTQYTTCNQTLYSAHTTHRTQARKMQHNTRQSRRGMAAHLIGAAAKSIHIAPAAGPAPAVARALTCLNRLAVAH